MPTRVCVDATGDPTNTRRPPASPGTASSHPCWCPGSRRASTPHPRTPHAGTVRKDTHVPTRNQHAPGNKPLYIRQPRARDTCKKIAASAHVMGSGGSAIDTMVIGCLGVECRAERFFSYLAIFLLGYPAQEMEKMRETLNRGSLRLSHSLERYKKFLVVT